MPELPEVEVTRRGVENRFLGCTLLQCTVRQPRLRWPVPEQIALMSGPLLATHRRSKYLFLTFEGGHVVVHLGMSGSLQIVANDAPWRTHEHVEWRFANGSLRLYDPRRFGSVEFIPPDQPWTAYARLSHLGPEPLTDAFDGDVLFKATRGRKLAIKLFLLSGVPVVGVGNIYASESLFRAGIRPGKASARLTRKQCHDLAASIIGVLTESIARGGSTLKDFAGVDGTLGHFQLHTDVYDREGLRCKRCESGVIKRVVQGQRSTFYCPACQY